MRGQVVGVLEQNHHGRLQFTYDGAWTALPGARPISLSLPFAGSPFDDADVRSFFAGYLPDDPEALRLIGERFGVSSGSLFGLLAAVGRDCAGALAVTVPGEACPDDAHRDPDYEILDVAALADALEELARRPLLAGPDRLRLSLAGVQSKTGVYVTEAGDIALPVHAYPTTHILKPEPHGDFPDLALLEHACLEMARELGLPAARSQLGQAGGRRYLLVERYDRIRGPGARVRRLHQEDFCQALGVPSSTKYEQEGGPGLAACFALCDRLSVPARERLRLLDGVLFNFLVGNADAHGKNFSVLYTESGSELAPLYDLVSTLVYESDPQMRMNTDMAMRIGQRYDASLVLPGDWQQLAKAAGFRWTALRDRLDQMSRRLPAAAIHVERALVEGAMETPLLHRAIDLILARCEHVRETHGLDPVAVEGLPARIRDATGHAIEPLQELRHRFDRQVRERLGTWAEERRRAQLAGRTDEVARLRRLHDAVVLAHAAWTAGTASVEQRDLLRRELGTLPDTTAS